MPDIPATIGNYEILRQIGSGGMGAVYQGRDPELDRLVAIKVIREEVHDQEVLDRFFREARAAAALRHANVITVYASGQHDHQPYIAMEYVEGESLADIIKQRRQLPLKEKISYIEQICAGLGYAHKAGIVHRDVKPANIMVDRDGIIRILDFGIARIEGSAMTQDGTMMGSLNYMSPEQMLGKTVDPRSDIFSVGSVAYEILSYQQAFKGNLNDGILHRLPHEHPPPLSQICLGLPKDIERVVLRALEKAPEHRYQTLADMRTALLEAYASSHGQPDAGREDDATVFLARPAGAGPSAVPSRPAPALKAPAPPSVVPPVASAPPLYAIDLEPEPDPEPQPSPASPGAGAPSVIVDMGARPTPPSQWPGVEPLSATVATPAPAAGIRLKSEAAPPARPAVSVGTAAKGATRSKSPAAAAARARTPTPAPPPTASSKSRKLMVAGGLAAAAVAGALAIPWLMTPADRTEIERARIEATMGQYRSAYRNRDLEGVERVFPAMPANTRQSMQRAFNTCLVYEVTFAAMAVALDPADTARAEVDLQSTHTCTPASGGRQTSTPRHERFTLKKNGEAWLIDSAAPARSAGGAE